MADEANAMHRHVEPFLAARAYSPDSAKQRRCILRRFLAEVPEPTTEHVLAWWASISELAPASRQAHLSCVRQFLGHLRTVGVINHDPTLPIRRPTNPQRPPVTLTPAQVILLLVSIRTLRERAVVALMLGCGLRACDVVALNVENVDLVGRTLYVRGKGNKYRLVPMPLAVVECVGRLPREVPRGQRAADPVVLGRARPPPRAPVAHDAADVPDGGEAVAARRPLTSRSAPHLCHGPVGVGRVDP